MARYAAVDRAPKPCLHKRVTHEHGSYACYVLDGCKCLPCAAANSRYETQRHRQRAYGREAYVDAAPTRQRIQSLMAAGVGLKRITELSGVNGGSLCSILYGRGRRGTGGTPRAPQRRVTRQLEARILAIPVDSAPLADGARVDATGTHRRVQALVTLGWSQSKLAAAIGMSRGNFGKMMVASRVVAGTARRVEQLYDERWDRPPPLTCWAERNAAARARNHALLHGWLPPLAWDDDGIDDPAARPAAVTLPPVNKKCKLPPVEELEWLLEVGESIAAIASRFGVSEDGVTTALRRASAA